MNAGGGGIRRLAPLLLVSLLLHLALLVVVQACRQRGADRRSAGPMSVDYVEVEAQRGARKEAAPLAPVAVTPAAPLRLPTPRPVPPASVALPERPQPARTVAPPPSARPVTGHAAPPAGGPAGLGVAPLAPGVTGGGEVSVRTLGGGQGAGRGSGTGSGTGGAPVTGATRHEGGAPGAAAGNSPGGGPAASLSRRAAYQALVRRLIEEHKEYPLAARRARREGSCERRFVLDRGGAVRRVEALTSCGHPFLDEAATRAVTAVGVFPPLPDAFPGTEAAFTVTISFTLARQ